MAANLRKSAEEQQKDVENSRILVAYSTSGNLQGVLELLKAGVSVNAEPYNRNLFYKSQNYMTPLQCAASEGHVHVLKALIEYGAALDTGDRYDITAMHLAAEKNHVACLQTLLESGAECNIGTKYFRHTYQYANFPHTGGTTPLHLAAAENNVECVKELILNGADYNAMDEQGRTSLFISAEKGFRDCILTLLRNAVGRDILSIPVRATLQTALHECVEQSMLECVQELVQHGSDVNYMNKLGSSPLHLAVQMNDRYCFDIVKLLVVKGYNADVTKPDSTGTVPLQYASFNCHSKQQRRPNLAAFLIAYGADFKNIKNKHGLTLLSQEMSHMYTDYTILMAMVNTLAKIPKPEDIGIISSYNGSPPPVVCSKYDWYRSLYQNPRSLQHLCRCVVRSQLGIHGLRRVNMLPLPNPTKDYILLNCTETVAQPGSSGFVLWDKS